MSNARKALTALIEEDADAYSITTAIEHARRVGVESDVSVRSYLYVHYISYTPQVLSAASVIAQERAQKRLLLQHLKTGL